MARIAEPILCSKATCRVIDVYSVSKAEYDHLAKRTAKVIESRMNERERTRPLQPTALIDTPCI